MRLMVFSDVHGNLPALEKVIGSESVDGYINLGDAVNYAPWSNECVEYIDTLKNCINIEGNHETYFKEKAYDTTKHPLVGLFFAQCFNGFTKQGLIENYKLSAALHHFKCVHTLESRYIFEDTEIVVKENTMIGHSHQQYLRKTGEWTLLNPGSVGQNRKFINMANYAIWNVAENSFELKSQKFDIDLVIGEMKARKYPADCINYYTSKARLN